MYSQILDLKAANYNSASLSGSGQPQDMRFPHSMEFKPSLEIGHHFGKEYCFGNFSRVAVPRNYHSELCLKQAHAHLESGVINTNQPSTINNDHQETGTAWITAQEQKCLFPQPLQMPALRQASENHKFSSQLVSCP